MTNEQYYYFFCALICMQLSWTPSRVSWFW